MILLDKNNYWRALLPLSQIEINHLFARFVAEQMVSGTIYVNNTDNPDIFYIQHPYGMSLLFGNTEDDKFNGWLKDYMLNNNGIRSKDEWLQAFPSAWNKRIAELLGNRLIKAQVQNANTSGMVEENSRVNFRFNREKYLAFKYTLGESPVPIVRTSMELYGAMEGTVVPNLFWDNAAIFFKKGIGFSMIIGNHPVCTAYSAFIFTGLLELGIETVAGYRGKGFALHTCAALIDYCLANGYEPVWACRLENSGSYNLALKLGFEPNITLPYYKLPV